MDYLRAESKSAEESKVEAKPADANVGSPAFEDYQPNFAESREVSSDEEDNSNLNEEKQAETTPFEKSTKLMRKRSASNSSRTDLMLDDREGECAFCLSLPRDHSYP